MQIFALMGCDTSVFRQKKKNPNEKNHEINDFADSLQLETPTFFTFKLLFDPLTLSDKSHGTKIYQICSRKFISKVKFCTFTFFTPPTGTRPWYDMSVSVCSSILFNFTTQMIGIFVYFYDASTTNNGPKNGAGHSFKHDQSLCDKLKAAMLILHYGYMQVWLIPLI